MELGAAAQFRNPRRLALVIVLLVLATSALLVLLPEEQSVRSPARARRAEDPQETPPPHAEQETPPPHAENAQPAGSQPTATPDPTPERERAILMRVADLRKTYHSHSNVASLHSRLADLLLAVTPPTREALATLANELTRETESPQGSPDVAGLLAFALAAAGGEHAALESWHLALAARPPVPVLWALGLRFDLESTIQEEGTVLEDAVAGVMLTRLSSVCMEWRREFFKQRLGDRYPGETPRTTLGNSPLEVLDLQLRRAAGERLTRHVSETVFDRVREFLIDDRQGDQGAAVLNALHIYQRNDPVVKRDLVAVAVSESAATSTRIVALRLLSHPLEPELKQRLLDAARREHDPNVLPVLIDALRLTDTRPGPLLESLFQRATTTEAKRAIGRIAASLADHSSDPALVGVFGYIMEDLDGELLVELLGKLERRGLLDRQPQSLIDAIVAVLTAKDETTVLRILEFVRAHRMVEVEPTLRFLASNAAAPRIATAARATLDALEAR